MTEAVSIRLARPSDAAAMAALINPIIAKGGTTALEEPLDALHFERRIAGFPARDFAHVALDGDRLVGFQFVEAHQDLPDDMGDIATFVALGAARRGVGRALCAATFAEAKARGWRAVFAYIRADNAGGLAFYEKIGLRTDRIDEAVPLKTGAPVDRIGKVKAL